MKPIIRRRAPEKTALILGPYLLAAILLAALWLYFCRLFDRLPAMIRRRWPVFYNRCLTREVYLPSTAYAILKHPLRFSDSEIPYNLEYLRGYPLRVYVDKLSRRQVKAFDQKRGTICTVDPYVQAILFSRLQWIETPAKGMETGHEYRKRALHYGDFLEEPTQSHLFQIIWDWRTGDWSVKDIHYAFDEDHISGPVATPLPLFLQRWDGLLKVLG